jgi:hypothetical protein
MAGENEMKIIFGADTASLRAQVDQASKSVEKFADDVQRAAGAANKGFDTLRKSINGVPEAFDKVAQGSVVLSKIAQNLQNSTAAAGQTQKAFEALGRVPLKQDFAALDQQIRQIRATLSTGLKATFDTSALNPAVFTDTERAAERFKNTALDLSIALSQTAVEAQQLGAGIERGFAQGITEELQKAGVSVHEFKAALSQLTGSGGANLTPLLNVLDSIQAESGGTVAAIRNIGTAMQGVSLLTKAPVNDLKTLDKELKIIKQTLASGFKPSIDKIQISPRDFTAVKNEINATTESLGRLDGAVRKTSANFSTVGSSIKNIIPAVDAVRAKADTLFPATFGRKPLANLNDLDKQLRVIKATLASGFKPAIENISLKPANFANYSKQLTVFNSQVKATQTNVRQLEVAAVRGTGALSGMFKGLAAGIGFGVFASASRSISNFVGGAIGEFLEAERAIGNLRQSLEAIGREDVFEGLLKSSSDLAKQFAFVDNDDITNAFQRLIQVGGLTEDSIRRLLPLILDLNAKQRLAGDTNKSVADTAEDIVKGLNGQGRELKKYGIELKASNTEAQNLGIILEQLGPKVRGAGDAFANSLEGKIAATTIRVNELQESLGQKLLPLKAGLLQFANDVASGFGLLIDRLQLGASAFDAMQNLKVRVDFVQGKSTDKFDAIKDLPLDELTTELLKYQASLDRTNAAIRANKSGEAAITQWKLEAEVVEDVIGKIKEQIRLRGDDRKLGTHIKEEAKDHKAVADALSLRIAALKELIAAQRQGSSPEDIFVTDETLELKAKEIQLLIRDAKAKGFTPEEIQKLINLRFPEFSSGIELSKPIVVATPLDLKIDVQKTISAFDATGKALADAQSRMYAVIGASGKADGDKARAEIAKPIEALNTALNAIQKDAFAGLGEAFAESVVDGNPVKAFVAVIATALEQLGKALLAFAAAEILAQKALASFNPYIALAAGIAAIGAAKLLQKQLNSKVALAEGGIVRGPTTALIGEAGPEAVIPLSRANNFTSGGSEGYIAETRLQGRDILLMIRREIASQNRTGGLSLA